MNYLLVAEIPHANDFFLVMEGVTRSNRLQMPYWRKATIRELKGHIHLKVPDSNSFGCSIWQ